MADLWVLVPSRGRPKSVDRLVRACALTCQADTKLHFAFDDDDPDLEASVAATAGHRYTIGPRQGLAGWTNDLARRHVDRSDAACLASIGDDMLPVTGGWDALLVAAARGGFAYPNDFRRADIPEAVVIDARIVAALGWMAHPGMHHWFIDNVWADLGRAADAHEAVERYFLHPVPDGYPWLVRPETPPEQDARGVTSG